MVTKTIELISVFGDYIALAIVIFCISTVLIVPIALMLWKRKAKPSKIFR